MQNNPTWVSVTACFNMSNMVEVFEVVQKKFTATDNIKEQYQYAELYTKNITRLRNISDKDYPVQIVPDSANIDDAIDVFDRVNSLGTKLTDAELALTHITGKWPTARREMKRKIEELERKHFSFDLNFMTRSLVGVIYGRALYEIIHKTEHDLLLDGWEKLKKILDYLIAILPGSAYIHSTTDLSSSNVLVPVIVYLARHDGRFPNDKELKHCIHWLYAAIMWSRYSSQTDQRLDHDISIIVQWSESPWKEMVAAIIEQRGRIEVKPIDLEGRGIQHPLYRMMFIVAKSQSAVDWFNGSLLSASFGKYYSINNCYIFTDDLLSEMGGYYSEKLLSKSELRWHKKLVNEIANRAFLTADSKATLGNTDPAHYLELIDQKYAGALAKQFIPLDKSTWDVHNFRGFLAARRKLIADAINGLMQKMIAEPEIEPKLTLEDLLVVGESAILEYKSSFRWDLKLQKYNDELTKMIFKTIAGFMNVEGGTLLIGVADDGTVPGIEYDLKNKPQDMQVKDQDEYNKLFQNKLLQYLDIVLSPYIYMSFSKYNGHAVAIVEADRSPRPVFLKDKNSTEFFMRAGNTTQQLDVESSNNYISTHWDV